MGTNGNMQGERKDSSPATKARPKLTCDESISCCLSQYQSFIPATSSRSLFNSVCKRSFGYDALSSPLSRQRDAHRSKSLLHRPRTELCDEDRAYYPGAIDEIRRGNGCYSIGKIDPVPRIEEKRIGDVILTPKWGNILFRIGLINSQQGECSMCLSRDAFEKRHLDPARRAGLRPEVDEYRMATKRVEINDTTPSSTVDRQRKFGRCRPHRHSPRRGWRGRGPQCHQAKKPPEDGDNGKNDHS